MTVAAPARVHRSVQPDRVQHPLRLGTAGRDGDLGRRRRHRRRRRAVLHHHPVGRPGRRHRGLPVPVAGRLGGRLRRHPRCRAGGRSQGGRPDRGEPVAGVGAPGDRAGWAVDRDQQARAAVPNGAAICRQLGEAKALVVGASLRNASACAEWVAKAVRGPVAVVAAGERWPGDVLRPAVEDLWGAGLVIDALAVARRRPGVARGGRPLGPPTGRWAAPRRWRWPPARPAGN